MGNIGANISDVGAGSLRELFAFDHRPLTPDGYGNSEGEFAEQFRAAAGLQSLKGTEAVMASRLEGKQPYILTVRYSAQTAQVTPDWRCRNARTGVAYAITTHVPRSRKDYIDLIIVEGVADSQVASG